jgi:4-diphosphocytidyl-2-C-methyl-D-erythritol kinase
MNPVVMSAPAKLNLFLRVGPRRSDGFHGLASWFVTCGLRDELTFEPAGSLSLSCDDPSLPVDDTNLILKAARALQQSPVDAAGARMHLRKCIPMGAGLGGGSSNAAAALQGLNRLWSLNHSLAHLTALGAGLGSDVPFFLHAPSAMCRGRGEVVQPMPAPRGLWALLMLPSMHMPTPAVYRRFDEMGLGADLHDHPAVIELAPLPAESLLPRLFNDLEPPAFAIAPALSDLRQRAEWTLGRIVRMSGSGSSLFTLFDSRSDASDAAARIARDLQLRTEVASVA